MRYEYLIPTSDPDLFVTREGRLLHRLFGPLRYDASRVGSFLSLPDKSTLRVYWGAPPVELDIEPFDYAKLAVERMPVAAAIGAITAFVSAASDYLTVATVALEVLDFVIGAVDQTASRIVAIDRQLQALASQMNAMAYLDLLRRMNDMRANARSIIQTLDALRSVIASSPVDAWYRDELKFHDAQLHNDINALLGMPRGYFLRPYYEPAIIGDGQWMNLIPDRPVQEGNTTFEYRLALPTVAMLIAVRLTMMKFIKPDFVSTRYFASEIWFWYENVGGIAQEMHRHIRTTKPTPIEVQCMRRQQDGHQRIGEFQNWNQHCTIGAPYSINPIAAVDITTGFGIIDWDYTQFDEWYLGQGDLHGHTAGYWPPSVGPQYYRPPPQATGLPPYEFSIGHYYSVVQGAANGLLHQVARQIGQWGAAGLSQFCLDLLYPVSDIRLKQDIVQVARLDYDLGLYRYRYKWNDQLYVGVVAQEVATIMPNAVVQGPDGYLRVNYWRLGMRLMTWDQWVMSQDSSVAT